MAPGFVDVAVDRTPHSRIERVVLGLIRVVEPVRGADVAPALLARRLPGFARMVIPDAREVLVGAAMLFRRLSLVLVATQRIECHALGTATADR